MTKAIRAVWLLSFVSGVVENKREKVLLEFSLRPLCRRPTGDRVKTESSCQPIPPHYPMPAQVARTGTPQALGEICSTYVLPPSGPDRLNSCALERGKSPDRRVGNRTR
jgi:hypothetical protein